MKKIAKITLEVEVTDDWKNLVAVQDGLEERTELTDGVACALARRMLADEIGGLLLAKLGAVKVKTFRIDYEGKEKKR